MNEASWQAKWSTVAIVLAVVAVSVIATLVVVVATNDVDTLSTVALALALVAFAGQLIVSLVLGYQTSHVNADTRALLAKMDTSIESLTRAQEAQISKLLDVLIPQVASNAVDQVATERQTVAVSGGEEGAAQRPNDSQTRAELESLIEQSLRRAIREQTAYPGWSSQLRDEILRVTPNGSQRWAIDTFPTEDEARTVVPILTGLSKRAMAALGAIGMGLVNSSAKMRSTLVWSGTDAIGPGQMELAKAGLISIESSGGVSLAARVTPDGYIALRILGGKGEPPSWVQDAGLA